MTAGAYQYKGVGVGSGGVYRDQAERYRHRTDVLRLSGPWPGDGIVVDGSGNAYLTGNAAISDFPTTSGAYQTTYPGAFAPN